MILTFEGYYGMYQAPHTKWHCWLVSRYIPSTVGQCFMATLIVFLQAIIEFCTRAQAQKPFSENIFGHPTNKQTNLMPYSKCTGKPRRNTLHSSCNYAYHMQQCKGIEQKLHALEPVMINGSSTVPHVYINAVHMLTELSTANLRSLTI